MKKSCKLIVRHERQFAERSRAVRNLPAVTADAIWSTGEKPKSKNSFYGNEIFLTYNRYAPFQRSTFVFQANAKTEPAIIDLDRVMWRLLKNSVELRLALKKIRKMGDDWRGSVQPAAARCPSPEGHESNCSNDTKWHEAKCKDCRLGLWGLKGVAVCLTFQHKSCRHEQCADTGHLAFTSSIIHHFKNEFCRFPSKPRFSYSTRACLFVYVWNIMKRKLSISVVNTERAEGGCNSTPASHCASVPSDQFRRQHGRNSHFQPLRRDFSFKETRHIRRFGA